MPPSGDDELGGTKSGSESSGTDIASDSDTTDDGGCPVGVDGCPCTDAATCFPGLECVDEECVPAVPCPIGESGCPCTNFGTCDPGSTCEAGVCSCEAGELGCECLDDGCGNALDCVDGLCSIPELVSEAADGWGPVTCWAQRGGSGVSQFCTAPRGDVFQNVISACEVAERLLDGEWKRGAQWQAASQQEQCAAGSPVPPSQAPWDDVACFLQDPNGIAGCYGRIGHLWTNLTAECEAPPNEFTPWGADQMMVFGCAVDSPPPADNDVDEWRCGPDSIFASPMCRARRGNLWTDPRPPCWIDLIESLNDQVDWSPFACESAFE
jgi:hypothetical protein